MPNEKIPRVLQQQPARDNTDPQQQRSGSTDFQQQPQAREQQMGEGSYEATRDYQKNIGEYLSHADVEADAKAAKPKSQEEAREMKQAEEEGKSHSKGEH